MLLENRNAIVYGGGGVIGGAVARAFARDGARVFVAGRTPAKLARVVDDVVAAGGAAEQAVVDVLDEEQVRAHVAEVVERAATVDVVFNAVGFDAGEQGFPLVEMSAEEYAAPLAAYPRAQFVIAKAVAGPMCQQGHGVILALSQPMAGAPEPLAGSFGNALAAVENLSRQLAAELGPDGIRVVCLRPTGMPDGVPLGSHTAPIWQRSAERFGVPFAELLETIGSGPLLGKPMTVAALADAAALLASDRARAFTGTVANVSGGAVPD